jgi:hypothetical protein
MSVIEILFTPNAIEAAAKVLFYEDLSITHDEGGKRWEGCTYKSAYRELARMAIRAALRAATERASDYAAEQSSGDRDNG